MGVRGEYASGMLLGDIFGSQGIIVLIIVLIVIFGGSQLPKIARNVGTAGKEFRKAQQEAEEEARAKEAEAAKAEAAKAEAARATAALPPAAVAPASPKASGDEQVTLSKSELDALLAEREALARRQPGDQTV